jgi:hypothetical protein
MQKIFNVISVLGIICFLSAALVSAQVIKAAASTNANSKPADPADPKAAPATPIDAKKAELGGKTWNPDWDHFVEQSIPSEMLSSSVPHDVRRFCPNFYRMSDDDKRVFWAYFFQALAGAEAGLNPTTNVRHPQMAKVDKVTGQPVHSEGLLQLTYEDQKIYGCDFDYKRDRELPSHDSAKTILQPERNLGCGIKILDNQITTLHKPIVTKVSYWSTLQPGTVSYPVFAKEMTNPPAACEKPQRPSHLKNATTATVKAAAEAQGSEQASAGH